MIVLPGGTFNTSYQEDLAILRTRMQWALTALGVAIVFALPLFAGNYWLGLLTRLSITLVAVLGLHILTGLCGQISVGHAAFVGVGAYAVAILTAKQGVNGWLCLPISGLAAALVGVVFGLPAFRLKGFFLAMSTLAASYIIIWCFGHFKSWTGGLIGLGLEPLTLGGIDFGNRGPFYILAILVLIVATLSAKNIQRTATGRAFVAIRDNELAAEVSGININRYKMLAFFIGCLYAGVAGWLWAYSQLRVNPSQFPLLDSIWYLGMIIVGGWGSTAGVFLGAGFLEMLEVGLSDYLSPYLTGMLPSEWAQQVAIAVSLMAYGIVIIMFMLFEPRGMSYLLGKVKTYYRLHPYAFSPG